jgi:hypothetical protein
MRIALQRARLVALATVVAVSLAPLSVAAQSSRPVVQIDNFAQVNPNYFRGAQPEGSDYADLAQLGVKTVINLIGDSDLDASEQAKVERQGMR